MYVWSCLVIALATLFLERFWRNFTQVFSMARPRTSSRFMMLHQRSRSLLLFLENVCHRSSDFISWTILTNFTQVFSMARPRTSSRFMKLRQRSRSLLLFLENPCHHFGYIPIAHNYRVEGICIVCDILFTQCVWPTDGCATMSLYLVFSHYWRRETLTGISSMLY
jgi:hypothetical protein